MRRKKTFNDFPFPYHTEIEVTILSLSNEGRGIARVPLPDSAGEGSDPGMLRGGWVIMVPFVLPGESVRVRVFRNHRNFSEADLIGVLRPAADRSEPVCPLFGRCGGCQYQHIGYATQLEWKRRQVSELLQHLAGVEFPVDPVVPSPKEFGYRSKITPHYPQPRADRPLPLGFLRDGSRHEVVDVPHCALASEALNARLAVERKALLERAAAGGLRRGGTLLLRDTAQGVVTDPNATALARVDGLELEFPAGDFFQNNPHLLEAFTRHVASEAARCGATCLVDTYCGSGLFALTAASRFQRIAGVEISAQAVERARSNARRNGIGSAEFLAADASAIFSQITFPAAETAVVIDPPRRGSDEAFLQQLIGFAPRTVVYVSCNPATQMRDLRLLLDAGYRMLRVQPFDLFPQTKHLECVITLER